MENEDRIPVAQAADIFRRARELECVGTEDTAVIFHDLGRTVARVRALTDAFPETALHAVAVKANPLLGVLRRIVGCGAGLEAASIEEAHLALAAGCPPERTVFDSPAKTPDELAFALQTGIHVNADDLKEIERIDRIRASVQTRSRIGLRINPEVGAGSIAATSVAAPHSRFGVPLERATDAIVDFFLRRW